MTQDGFELWLEWEHVDGGIDDFANVLVTLENGDAHALNVWTYDFFATTLKEPELTANPDLQHATSVLLTFLCANSADR